MLLNRGTIQALTKIPRDDLLALASRGCLQLSYVKPTFGVITSGAVRVHDFSAFEVGPKDKSKRLTTFQEEIADAFVAAYGDSWGTKSAAKKFIDHVKLFRHPEFNSKTNIVCDLARTDIKNPRFVEPLLLQFCNGSPRLIRFHRRLSSRYSIRGADTQWTVILIFLLLARRAWHHSQVISLPLTCSAICRRQGQTHSSRHIIWPNL